jgi:hypothetical protein
MARQVADNQYSFDPFTNSTPVRSNLPRLAYLAGPASGSSVNIWGIAGLVALVLVFEHFRLKGARK